MSKKWTTTADFISNGKFQTGAPAGLVLLTEGFDNVGDGAGAKWVSTGNVITPSQSPTDLGVNFLSDSRGNEFQLIEGQTQEFTGVSFYVGGFGGSGLGTYIYSSGGWVLANSTNALSYEQYNTFAELESLSPTEGGLTPKRYICVERANAEYLLQPVGYVALVGDTTFSNGRVAKLQTGKSINAGNFGTILTDNTGDSAGIINNAIFRGFQDDFRGYVDLPSGTIRTLSPVVVIGTGIRLRGNLAERATVISADFIGTDYTDAPAVIVRSSRHSGVVDLSIEAGATRSAASYDAFNVGLLVVEETSNTWFGKYEGLEVLGHPSDGILSFGGGWFTKYQQCRIYENKGQGMRFDSGYGFAGAHIANPGEIDVSQCMIYDNLGVGLQIGNDDFVSNRGFRFQLNNVDLFRNAGAAGSRKAATQIWAFMDASRIECGATDGYNLDETAIVSRGIIVAGRAIDIVNNRFLNSSPQHVRIEDFESTLGYQTEGIKIDGMSIFQDGTPLMEAVSVAPTCKDIQISPRSSNSQIDGIVGNALIPYIKRTEVARTNTTQTAVSSTTLTDIGGLSIPMLPTEKIQFTAKIVYRGDVAAGTKLAITAPAGSTVWYGLTGNDNDVSFSSGAGIDVENAATNGSRVATITGNISTNGTGGLITVQHAQTVSSASGCDILSNSYIEAIKH